jgi:broad specificity phosphatase PhoE
MFWKTKEIYFVRHGQSANNAEHIRQGASGGLSEKGIRQSNFVGERFKNIPIDVILISPYERTIKTAEIINAHLHKPTEELDLLVERRNPSEIIGKDAESLEVKKIMDQIDRSYHDSNFRYSDEENFEDLKGRAKNLLSYLSSRKEEKIMCVSHRIFLKMVAAYIENGEALTSEQFVKLDFLNTADNGSVTFAKYSPYQAWKARWRAGFGRGGDPKEQAGWRLLAWNDAGRIV